MEWSIFHGTIDPSLGIHEFEGPYGCIGLQILRHRSGCRIRIDMDGSFFFWMRGNRTRQGIANADKPKITSINTPEMTANILVKGIHISTYCKITINPISYSRARFKITPPKRILPYQNAASINT